MTYQIIIDNLIKTYNPTYRGDLLMGSSTIGQTNLGIERTKALLKYNFRQFIEFGPGKYLPLSLWGHAGVGKTSLINQVAEELAEELSAERGEKVTIGVRSFQMSAMQPFELSGYPMIDDVTGGRKIQKYATPEFLIEAEKYTYFICFFDEWNRARTEMHNAFMGYIDGRGVNGHSIPNNMFCVTAANPVTDDSSYGAVTDVDDQAILDRLIHINVVPTSEEFDNFLYSSKECNSFVQAFLEEDQERRPVNSFEGITSNIRKTNRGYVDVAKALNFLLEEANALDRKALITAVAKGILGDHAGNLFAERFGKVDYLTTPEELLKGDKTAFDKVRSAVGKGEEENRLDQVSAVAKNFIRYLKDPARSALNKTKVKNLLRFVNMVPHDIGENLLTKARFTEEEMKIEGLRDKIVTKLEVTSDTNGEDLEWR